MASRVGWVQENPVTQERATVLIDPAESGGVLAALLEIGPDARVVGEHFHPELHERFRVLSGTLGVNLDGARSEAGPGEVVDVAPRTVHDWWNAGDGPASVLVWVDPGERFTEMITTLFGLARSGRTNAKGMPDPLQLAVIATEFRDTAVFTSPPPVVQRVLLGALAVIGRAMGRRATYPEFGEPVEVVVPDPELLEIARRDGPGGSEGSPR